MGICKSVNENKDKKNKQNIDVDTKNNQINYKANEKIFNAVSISDELKPEAFEQGDKNLEKTNDKKKNGKDGNNNEIYCKLNEIIPNAVLFPDEFKPEYFQQGYIGDCYLISTIEAISKFPELIRSFFINPDNFDPSADYFEMQYGNLKTV